MEKFRFLKWNVYKEAKELLALILKIVKKLPKDDFEKSFVKINSIAHQLGGFKKSMVKQSL